MLKAFTALLFAVVVATLLVIVLKLAWSDRRIDARDKILRTISCVFWALLFMSIEVILAYFALTGEIIGSRIVFLFASACVCLGGISSLAAQLRYLEWRMATVRTESAREGESLKSRLVAEVTG